MNKISIFEFLKKNDAPGLFIKSPAFLPYVKKLAEKYNGFLENDEEKEYSMFMINENSTPEFVIIRFLILVKKHLGESALLEIYKNLTEEILLVRNFLIKNKIDERRQTAKFVDELKKQKNFTLLDSGNFKAEDVLYSKIEEENETKEKNKNIFNNNKTLHPDDSEKKEKRPPGKGYLIKNDELFIYAEDGRIIKRIPAFLTESDRKKPFITPFAKHENKYYYLGKYTFGRNIKLTESTESDEKIKKILLKLIDKIN